MLKARHPSFCLALVACFLVVTAPSRSLSQDRPEELKDALRRENNGDYNGAFELYMKYERANPGSVHALSGMGRTAKRTGRRHEFLATLARRFDEFESDREIARLYMQALSKSGETRECLRVGRESVSRWPGTADIYTSTSALYRSNGLVSEAIDVLREGRRTLGNPELFRREMAELLSASGDHLGAVREFIGFYRTNERSLSYVAKRLLETARELGDTEQVIEAVEDAGGGEECGLVLPLVIDLEIDAGAYDRALSLILSCRERQPDRVAEELTRLSRVSLKNGEEELAKRALVEALGFAGGARPEVRLQLAEELGKMGKAEEALSLLETMEEENIARTNRIKLYELLGDLTLQSGRDPRRAIEWYGRLEGEGVPEEKLALFSLKVALAMLEAGELEAAVLELVRLNEGSLEGSVAPQVVFELANAYLYSGRIEEALVTYRKLIERTPGYPAAGDAIDALRLERSFGEEGREALRAIGSAKYAERRGEREVARRAYAGALEVEGPGALADEIGLMMADFLSRTGSPGEALSLYRTISQRSLEDYLAARALTGMARLYYFVLGDRVAAREALETVLLRYGDVVEAEEARRILAEIKKSS